MPTTCPHAGVLCWFWHARADARPSTDIGSGATHHALCYATMKKHQTRARNNKDSKNPIACIVHDIVVHVQQHTLYIVIFL